MGEGYTQSVVERAKPHPNQPHTNHNPITLEKETKLGRVESCFVRCRRPYKQMFLPVG